MIKVQCPSCAAPYELDERRMPNAGLNMRCPQCTTVFCVHQDGSITTPEPQGSSGQAQVGGDSSTRATKKTEIGVGISAPPPPMRPAGTEATSPQEIPEPISLPPFGNDTEEVDLPMPVEDVDLPAPTAPPPKTPPPVISASEISSSDVSLDIPSPDQVVDLPRAKGDEIDLPQLRGETVDLPQLRGETVDLPQLRGDKIDLPGPVEPEVDLPLPKHDLDLPVGREEFERIQEERDASRPSDLFPMGKVNDDLPPPPAIDLETGELPPIAADEVANDLLMPSSGDDFDLGFNLELDDFRQPAGGARAERIPSIRPDFDPGAATGIPLRPGPGGAPGTELEELGEEGQGVGDGLEFSDLPEVTDAALTAAPLPGTLGTERERIKRKFRIPIWVERFLPVFVVLIILLIAGYSLKGTKYGIFGKYAFERFFPSAGDDAHVAEVIGHAEEVAIADTYAGTKEAIDMLERLLRTSSLNRRLLARTLLHESLYQIRFGADEESARRADEIVKTLEERSNIAPGIEAALAADMLRRERIGGAMSAVQRARVEAPGDPYVELVAGEVSLMNGDAVGAVAAFQASATKNGGARAQWGLARAHRANGDLEKAHAAEAATLQLSSNHVAARTVVAKRWLAKGKVEEAFQLLEEPAGLKLVDGQELPAAAHERSEVLTVVGDIEQHRGRRGAARAAYQRASELNSQNHEANYGLGTVLLADGNYKEAFTRFQSLMTVGAGDEEELEEGGTENGQPVPSKNADGRRPLSVRARIGAAEALISMALPQEAAKKLAGLEEEYPEDPVIAYWVARAAAARNQDKMAIKYYRRAIKLDPNSFRSYIGLSQHLADTGNPKEALAVLKEAARYVPMTAEVARLRGEAQLAQGRVDEAIPEFEHALRLEPENLAVRFQLARGLRMARRFVDATQVLASIERVDPFYPGLAVEKGLISESNGDMEAAVSNYRAALEANENDFGLKVRLAAALLAVGSVDEAETLLQKALEEKPYSAEVEHFLGRVEFSRGRIRRARQHFEKASRLDRSNGMYIMYLGWAALEANELASALKYFEKALSADASLGDAYWLRARIRIRTGAVQDALKDLEHARELSPARTDVLASMAECYEQLGQNPDAIRLLKDALSREPGQGEWWYRLGRLQINNGQPKDGYASLDRAAKLGDSISDPPRWLADTHLWLGENAQKKGDKVQATVHYRRYLDLAPQSAIDRESVEQRLEEIGPVVVPEEEPVDLLQDGEDEEVEQASPEEEDGKGTEDSEGEKKKKPSFLDSFF